MAVEFAGAYKYTYTNSGTKIQKKFYVSKKIDENLPNFYILYGKLEEMGEMEKKNHSSTRRGNTKKRR